mmetsp:Transcript_21326/g.32862  ORF Transcript_21326/g.32862 Transcript_21326/m.32862 type:complete len:130 (+) Transcript_21326:631-1020(+)
MQYIPMRAGRTGLTTTNTITVMTRRMMATTITMDITILINLVITTVIHKKTNQENTNNPNHASQSTMAMTAPDGTDDKQRDSKDDPAIISVPVRSTSTDDNGVHTDDHHYDSISTLGTVEEGRARQKLT